MVAGETRREVTAQPDIRPVTRTGSVTSIPELEANFPSLSVRPANSKMSSSRRAKRARRQPPLDPDLTADFSGSSHDHSASPARTESPIPDTLSHDTLSGDRRRIFRNSVPSSSPANVTTTPLPETSELDDGFWLPFEDDYTPLASGVLGGGLDGEESAQNPARGGAGEQPQAGEGDSRAPRYTTSVSFGMQDRHLHVSD